MPGLIGSGEVADLTWRSFEVALFYGIQQPTMSLWPRMGPRNVATGGAERNPWIKSIRFRPGWGGGNSAFSHIVNSRRRLPQRLLLRRPLRGEEEFEKRSTGCAAAALPQRRSTRGYNPTPHSGRKHCSSAQGSSGHINSQLQHVRLGPKLDQRIDEVISAYTLKQRNAPLPLGRMMMGLGT